MSRSRSQGLMLWWLKGGDFHGLSVFRYVGGWCLSRAGNIWFFFSFESDPSQLFVVELCFHVVLDGNDGC